MVVLLFPQTWPIQDTASLVEAPSMLALVVAQYLHHASRGPRRLLGTAGDWKTMAEDPKAAFFFEQNPLSESNVGAL